jgi:hypothetical protein
LTPGEAAVVVATDPMAPAAAYGLGAAPTGVGADQQTEYQPQMQIGTPS